MGACGALGSNAPGLRLHRPLMPVHTVIPQSTPPKACEHTTETMQGGGNTLSRLPHSMRRDLVEGHGSDSQEGVSLSR